MWKTNVISFTISIFIVVVEEHSWETSESLHLSKLLYFSIAIGGGTGNIPLADTSTWFINPETANCCGGKALWTWQTMGLVDSGVMSTSRKSPLQMNAFKKGIRIMYRVKYMYAELQSCLSCWGLLLLTSDSSHVLVWRLLRVNRVPDMLISYFENGLHVFHPDPKRLLAYT
jgi:hypothetical protein